jgi:hypothetical protein
MNAVRRQARVHIIARRDDIHCHGRLTPSLSEGDTQMGRCSCR